MVGVTGPRAAAVRVRRPWRFVLGLLLIVGNGETSRVVAEEAKNPGALVGARGLPLPRFASLKADRVNLRSGPGTDYPTVWEYHRAGLPIEVIEEHETWRKVRDAEGETGWVLNSLLSGRRTALILPWEAKSGAAAPRVALYASDSARSREVALIEAGVIANVRGCDGKWCSVVIDAFRGYIEQAKLWGVYENETVR